MIFQTYSLHTFIQVGTGQTQTEYLKKHREDEAARKAAAEAAAEAAKCAKATPQKPAEKK